MKTLLESIKDSLHEPQIDESILSSNNVGLKLIEVCKDMADLFIQSGIEVKPPKDKNKFEMLRPDTFKNTWQEPLDKSKMDHDYFYIPIAPFQPDKKQIRKWYDEMRKLARSKGEEENWSVNGSISGMSRSFTIYIDDLICWKGEEHNGEDIHFEIRIQYQHCNGIAPGIYGLKPCIEQIYKSLK